MPDSHLGQKAKPKSSLSKRESKKQFFPGYARLLCIFVLAVGVVFLPRYLPPNAPNPLKSEAVESALKAFVDSRVCQSLRPSVVTIYAQSEVGSGSIVDLKHYAGVKSTSSFVITNSHVVAPAKGREVNIAIESKSFFTGKVIETDSTNDLAIVQLNVQDPLRQKISLAEATSKPQAGQLACTIGNPFNRSGIMTTGKLKGDRGDNDLKLDLSIHPGNSGGPLVDTTGKMIGVIKSALYNSDGKNSNISFATNLETINQFIQQNALKIAHSSQAFGTSAQADSSTERPIDFNPSTLQPAAKASNSEPTLSSEPWYGMDVEEDLTIILVDPESPAEKAGLTGGDRIISIDGKPVKTLGELKTFLKQHPTATTFTVERYQERQKYKILVSKTN